MAAGGPIYKPPNVSDLPARVVQFNSAVYTNASYQIVIEGSSYRERQSPHRALLDREGGD